MAALPVRSSPRPTLLRPLATIGLSLLAALATGGDATAQSTTPFCFGDITQVIPCPCGQFGAAGEGCLNSSGTGGLLSAAGSACVTCGPDTLMLTASGLPVPTFCILLQGSLELSPPAPFGDGLRCVGGALLRLYTLPATGGTVSFPAIGAPSISARSMALSDPIPAGGRRYYQVWYRDMASFCTPWTFNITNGIDVVWR